MSFTHDQAWRNVLRPDLPHSPFSALFGHFSIGFDPSVMGLASLSPKSALATYEVCSPVLSVGFLGEGLRACRRDRLTSWPWLVEEEGIFTEGEETLSVLTRSAFADERSLEFELTVENLGSAPSDWTPVLYGMALEDDRVGLAEYFPGASRAAREVSSSVDQGELIIRYDPAPTQASLPGVEVRVGGGGVWKAELTGAAPFGETGDSGPWHRLTPVGWRQLEPGEQRTLSLRVSVILWQPGEEPPFLAECPALGVGEAARRQKEEWLRRLGSERGLAARARLALLRTGLRGLNGEFGDQIASLCTSSSDDFSSSFFWDTLFTSTALARFDPEFAKGAIRTAFVRHDPRDGSTPERKWNFGPRNRMAQQDPQSPIASMAVCQLLRSERDEEFLDQMMPLLEANHRFWRDFSDSDGDGLAEYRWSGQAGDNSPLWDEVMGSTDSRSGCGWLPPIASVPLNCFLYWDARHLQCLALAQGREEEGELWKRRADQIVDSLHRVCLDREDLAFWDYDHRRQRRTKARTFFMFWPLIVDLPMPPSVRDSLLERLLDVNQFFGPVPFPSVPYDDPLHEPDGYWRGKSWPHITFWLTSALWRNGFEREADEAAERALFAMSSAPGFLENQSSLLGGRRKGGFPDYNWGCAAALLLTERAYRDPWQPEDGLSGLRVTEALGAGPDRGLIHD